MIKKFLRNYLNYSPGELVSLSLFFVLILISLLLKQYVIEVRSEKIDYKLDSIEQVFADYIESLEVVRHPNPSDSKIPKTLFSFDPNTISPDSLEILGFSKFASANLARYREAGGKFNTAGDLLKIYGVDSSLIKRLKSWIVISMEEEIYSAGSETTDDQPEKENIILKPVNINTAGYPELLNIFSGNGLIAGRIIKYRELLGGYYSVLQLKEVYDMNDSIFYSVENLLFTDSVISRRLSISKSDYKDIISHPYLNAEITESIFLLRDFKEGKPVLNDLADSNIVEDSILQKILPYLEN